MSKVQDKITVEERFVLGEGNQANQMSPLEYLLAKPGDFLGSFILVLLMMATTLFLLVGLPIAALALLAFKFGAV